MVWTESEPRSDFSLLEVSIALTFPKPEMERTPHHRRLAAAAAVTPLLRAAVTFHHVASTVIRRIGENNQGFEDSSAIRLDPP